MPQVRGRRAAFHRAATDGAPLCTDRDSRSPPAMRDWHTAAVTRRLLTLADVAEVLNVSASQAYALVRNRDLRAVKIGGRGQWRVSEEDLEAYLSESYEATERYLAEHPFTGESDEDDAGAEDEVGTERRE